jgi:hypothetical protein
VALVEAAEGLQDSPGHDLLYTSSDLSRLDFPDEISFFDVTPRAQNAMMYDTL